MAPVPSSGAMKVVVLSDLAEWDQAPSSVREVAKARQIKARVRNDTFLDQVSTTLKSFYAKRIDSAPCSSPFSRGVMLLWANVDNLARGIVAKYLIQQYPGTSRWVL